MDFVLGSELQGVASSCGISVAWSHHVRGKLFTHASNKPYAVFADLFAMPDVVELLVRDWTEDPTTSDILDLLAEVSVTDVVQIMDNVWYVRMRGRQMKTPLLDYESVHPMVECRFTLQPRAVFQADEGIYVAALIFYHKGTFQYAMPELFMLDSNELLEWMQRLSSVLGASVVQPLCSGNNMHPVLLHETIPDWSTVFDQCSLRAIVDSVHVWGVLDDACRAMLISNRWDAFVDFIGFHVPINNMSLLVFAFVSEEARWTLALDLLRYVRVYTEWLSLVIRGRHLEQLDTREYAACRFFARVLCHLDASHVDLWCPTALRLMQCTWKTLSSDVLFFDIAHRGLSLLE